MFESFELSRFLGRPIQYFIFRRQGLTWRYCTGSQDQVVGGHTYTAGQIERSEIKQTAERAKDKLKITLAYLRAPDAVEYPSTQELGDNWFPFVPTSTVTVVCMAGHVGDTDPPAIEWMGQVTQPKFTDTELELTCEPTSGTDRARNQGAKWQRGCWKTVYSTGPRGCNLPLDAHRVQAEVTKLELAAGDVPPQAHVLVPGLLSHITALNGRTATWLDNASNPRSSAILAAYFAYEWRRLLAGLGGVHETTGFSWADGTELMDETSHPIQRVYYTKIPALMLADATGLQVGTIIEIEFPPSGTTGVLTAAVGLAMTCPAFADSEFPLLGGFLSWTDASGLQHRRGIASHAQGATVLTLLPGGPNPAPGDEVTALPGCERTWLACQKRGNTPNYGGAIYKPAKNPIEESMSWG